ncbi:MAG: DUF933 domain-containing protein [Oscillospiraceae bacterium]
MHSDIERGFIRAEVIAYQDMMACGSVSAAKDKGSCGVRARNTWCRTGI